MDRVAESEPVRLARHATEMYVKAGRRAALPADTSEELREQRAGVFVCIKKHGELRGCIGTTQATEANLGEEIIRNAIDCATKDPRFAPVAPEELTELKYTVDVLSLPEAVAGEADLDPSRYGVVVKSGWRSGLLLPDLEGVDTAAQQVDIARRKAGISAGESVTLYRFTATRHE